MISLTINFPQNNIRRLEGIKNILELLAREGAQGKGYQARGLCRCEFH